ncbi:patatin-like phospholipase family protein [Nocardiopsis potens]|uniref:patatin-like phospholipase family protein n=1 Tax=Nocardiopsis potens TaxID=1246458 RepID=UPI00034A4A61|nr:patatin-like phospholipase family protein [Nocardiopsis potens]
MRKALVLGGGGITGIAWQLGVLSWLYDAGLDLTDADLVVGTSAGSVVGAQITSGTPLHELYRRQLAPPSAEIGARVSRLRMARFALAFLGERDPRRARARVGRIAHKTSTSSQTERRAVIASRLPAHEWPDTDLRVVAVDAHTGDRAVLDREAGVPLVDAVAASCAVPGVWPPVLTGGGLYIDGGVHSPANVDLAEGYDRVVVLAPIPAGWGPVPGPAAQLAELPEKTRTALVTPDAASLDAFGGRLLDPARRAPAARAGRNQAPSVLTAVAAAWDG